MVAGEGDFAVEVVDMVGEVFDYVVAMAVAELVEEGDFVVEVAG
jgi:hypothetical protein